MGGGEIGAADIALHPLISLAGISTGIIYNLNFSFELTKLSGSGVRLALQTSPCTPLSVLAGISTGIIYNLNFSFELTNLSGSVGEIFALQTLPCTPSSVLAGISTGILFKIC